MQIKASRSVPSKGLNKDFGDTIFSNEYLYNLINAKISRDEGSDLLTITSTKGTLLQSIKPTDKTVMAGTVIGYSVIRQYLVVFAKGNNTDYIYRFELDNNNNLVEKLLYSGNFNFQLDAPIEAISNYESDDIIKTYWVDKNNNPRFINIVQEEGPNGKPYLLTNTDQFSFTRKLRLNEDFNVTKIHRGGRFHSGTVQYSFTYSVKNGVETSVFLTTGVSFVSHDDRAGAKDEVCDCSFNIVLEGLEYSNYDYVNAYAIERHDLNGTAVVRALEPVLLTSSKISITDTGKGSIIDSNTLLYIGGEPYHVNSIDVKDNHFFGADIVLKRNHLKSISDIITSEKSLPEANKSISFEWVLADYVKNNPVVTIQKENVRSADVKGEKYYDYEPLTLQYNTLGKDGVIRFFKPNETYRIGIQAQHETGNWSEVIYLNDYKVDKQVEIVYSDSSSYIVLKKNNAPLSDEDYKRIATSYVVKVPVPKVTLKPAVTAILKANGYLKVRLMYVELSNSDRHVVSQGIINSTIANTVSRTNNRYYSYSDYFFRTKPIRDAYYEQELSPWIMVDNINSFVFEIMNKSYLKRYTSKFLKHYHLDIISRIASTPTKKNVHYGEIPHPSKYDDNFIRTSEDNKSNIKLSDIEDNKLSIKNLWFIDGSIINGWSPEFTLDYYDLSNIKNIHSIGFNGIVTLDKSIQGYELFLNTKEYSYSNIVLNPDFAGKTMVLDNPINAEVFNNPNFHAEREKITPSFNLAINDSLTHYFNEYKKYVYNNVHVNNIANESDTAPVSIIVDRIRYLLETARYYSNPKDAVLIGEAFMRSSKYQLWGVVYDSEDLSRYQKHFRSLYFGKTYYFGSPVIGVGYLMRPEIQDYKKVNFDNDVYTEVDTKTYSYSVNELLAELSKEQSTNTLSKLDIKTGMLSYKNNSHIVFNLKPIMNTIGNGYTLGEMTNPSSVTRLGIPNPMKAYVLVNKNSDIFSNDVVELPLSSLHEGKSYADNVFTPHVANLGNFNNYLNNKIDEGHILDSAFLVDFLADVKNQYGGKNYENVLSNMFIPCSKGFNINNYSIITGQDGDTYYQRFDFVKTQPFNSNSSQELTEIISYMGCSFINLDGRYDKHRYSTVAAAKHKGNYGLYNNAYSQLNNFYQYRVLDYNKLNDDNKSNSVIWSKQKYNQELVDKWLNLNMLSTYDIEGKYGKINKIINFNDTLLAFQDRGIAQIVFNPRVQISTSDGVPIEITNSGKLEGHRYIATNIGCVNKWSIASSGRALYFMDNLNKDILRLTGNQFQNLSVEKSFSAWSKFFLNNIKEFTPRGYENFTTHADLVTGEVYFNWLKVQEKNNKLFDFQHYDYLDSLNNWHNKWYFAGSLVFNEDSDCFENEFDYSNVPYMFNIKNGFYAIKNSGEGFSIHQMNVGKYSTFFGKYCPIHVDYYIAPEYSFNKTFNNVRLTMDVMDDNHVFVHNKIFNKLKIATHYQHNTMHLMIDSDDGIRINPIVKKKFNNWGFPLPRHYRTLDRISNHWARIKFTFDYPLQNYRMRLHELITYYSV